LGTVVEENILALAGQRKGKVPFIGFRVKDNSIIVMRNEGLTNGSPDGDENINRFEIIHIF
jgi:hypothetical protein